MRVGDPSSGAILQPGAVIDLPTAWADRYITSGHVAEVEAKAEKPTTDKKKSK